MSDSTIDGAQGDERPRWRLIAVLTGFGAAMTAGAAFTHGSYVQSLLIQVGSTLVLFAWLAMLERRLERRIATLPDAGAQLRSALGGLAPVQTLESVIEAAVRRCAARLREAGLYWMPSGHDELVFWDRLVEPRVVWRITWGVAEGPVHRVVFDGVELDSEHSRNATAARVVSGEVARVDEASLVGFDEETERLLAEVLRCLERGDG